jgi:hypothetical protein
MIEGGIVRRAVFAEGLWMVDANGEQPPRDPQKDLGSTALATETGRVVPVRQGVNLPAGLLPEARAQSAA